MEFNFNKFIFSFFGNLKSPRSLYRGRSHYRGSHHRRFYRGYRRHHHYYRRRRHRRSRKTHFMNMKVKRSFLFRKRFLTRYLLSHWKDTLSDRKYWLFHKLASLQSMNTLLLYSKSLPKKYQMRLQRCKLNLNPALKRCESLYSKGNCEKISEGMVAKKCPKGKSRVGCCSCASPCPSGMFRASGFYCIPQRKYNLDQFKTLEECKKQNKNQQCSMVTKTEKKKKLKMWVSHCKKGFVVENLTSCKIACPKDYKIGTHGRCVRKGIMSIGTPFTWIKSDK